MAFLVLLFIFNRIVLRLFSGAATTRSSGYFLAEKRLSVLAVLFFAFSLHLCDVKYYLSWMSIGERVPALLNVGGLVLFMLFFTLMWRVASTSYGRIFGRHYNWKTFVLSNIKANLPIVIPWIVLSFVYDIATLLSWPALNNILYSEWGDLLFFGVFLVFVVLFFPPLVRRLWGCVKIPEGPLRDHLNSFCQEQNFSSDFFYWPLFEGRVLTAGVMGLLPGLRYILITPALVETMSLDELDAVMAHEIGHVKKKHMLFYVLLIGSFSFLIAMLTKYLLIAIMAQEHIYTLISVLNIHPDSMLTFCSSVPLLIVTLLYFRYGFGFFLRNFERQADLNVYSALGKSTSLISAFEKIAVISGTRDEPSWHHFGIGERVDYLLKCDEDPGWIAHQDKKVRWSLVGYFLIIVLSVISLNRLSLDDISKQYEARYTEAVFMHKIKQEPDKAGWFRLLGSMMLSKEMEERALVAFEKALELQPANGDTLNNIAWLLLTSKDLGLRDPLRALTLARSAVVVSPNGYILDTLATAYWANGFTEEAVETAWQAVQADPKLQPYFKKQAKRFRQVTYKEVYHDPVPKELHQKSVGEGE